MENEVIFAQYQALVKSVCDTYLNKYMANYVECTIDTANEFMDKFYEFYRKEIIKIARYYMQEAGLTSDISFKILSQNAYSIGKLYTEIMILSSEFTSSLKVNNISPKQV